MLSAPFENALVLTGPTGSGKSALALELAGPLKAEIVSMDSMALYRGMDIGTAKPTPEERGRAAHHLIDVLDPWESASVAWWLEQAKSAAVDIERRGRRVLFVGGTPLYLKALMFGLFQGPSGDEGMRARLAESDAAELFKRLAQVDPVSAARLHPNDRRRVIRALEVFELTGRPISTWQEQWSAAAPMGDFPSVLWVDLPRPELHERINARVDSMFARGLVEEVRGFLALGRPLSREAAQALGYKEVFEFLAGSSSLEQTMERVRAKSRQFAKRQITWFRHLPGCVPATPELTRELWQTKMG